MLPLEDTNVNKFDQDKAYLFYRLAVIQAWPDGERKEVFLRAVESAEKGLSR